MFPQNVSDSELIEFARNRLVKFSINNGNSHITLISETPVMDSNQLLGFLGGQLGICVLSKTFCICRNILSK